MLVEGVDIAAAERNVDVLVKDINILLADLVALACCCARLGGLGVVRERCQFA